MPADHDDAPLLTLRNASFVTGGRTILHNIDMAVHGGRITTLIGPNGAGKTTLARMLLGLIKPTTGRVWQRPGLSIGYVPQRIAVDPVLPLTVGRLLSLTARHLDDKATMVLEEVGVPHLFGRPVHGLSGGEMQRVLLARALLGNPSVLVLDEPTQNVDPAGQIDLYRLIVTIRDRRRCGVLLISHDLHIVMAATDWVICLNRHVCCCGQPEDVSRHPDYLHLLGHRDAEVLAIYPHRHDHRHAPSGEPVPDGGTDTMANNG